jgi:hypothetical protein
MDVLKPTPPVIISPSPLLPSVLPNAYPIPYGSAILVLLITVGIYIFLEFGANIADIGNNWAEVRCKPSVMPLAGLFGHDIGENFQFCIQQIIQEQTKGVTGPFAQGMGGFSSVLSTLMSSANSFRTTLATMVGGIIKMIGEFKSRMTALMGRVKITASRMKVMMNRIYGTMFAVVYMGISAQTGIASFGDSFIFKFIDFFCFAPGTKVMMREGADKNIQDVKVGDHIYTGGTVEAVIELPGADGAMYDLYGVNVSGGHRVWSYPRGEYISVKDHPSAILSDARPKTLWTLITSDRQIPVRGTYGYIQFADWEEMPNTPNAALAWEKIAFKILNPKRKHMNVLPPLAAPCLDKFLLVHKYKEGWIPICKIKKGDSILDVNGWTKVLGTCEREVYGGDGINGCRISDGIWVLQKDGSWRHPEFRRPIDLWKWRGYQLITESGSFGIQKLNSEGVIFVRDFTEVGHKNLLESYAMEDAFTKPGRNNINTEGAPIIFHTLKPILD